MSFNLDPPLGFRGLDPLGSVEVYSRHLPHWRQTGATYFVTFHLADALPKAKRDELASLRREWELKCPRPTSQDWESYTKLAFRLVEACLDTGGGKCWFKSPGYASEMERSLLHFHGVRYEVGCFVVMANHCHVLIRPYEGVVLEDEVGAMKSVVAKHINQQEASGGALWQQESYDRIIRDVEHLYRVVQYIGRNPWVAGVDQSQWRRWLNPEWAGLGWRFEC